MTEKEILEKVQDKRTRCVVYTRVKLRALISVKKASTKSVLNLTNTQVAAKSNTKS